MKTREIIKEINKLMRTWEDSTFRPIPYLGWFWRDIVTDYPNDTIVFSKPDDAEIYYIDMAGKWDYPIMELTLEEAHPILEKMLISLKAVLDLANVLKRESKKDA